MNKTLTLISFLLLFAVLPVNAQLYDESPTDDFENFSTWRNPFKPQLPVKEEKKKPVVIKPVKIVVPIKKIEKKIKEIPQPEVEEGLPISITISGLVWNSNLPQAILNGRVVRIGDKDKTGDIEVVDINKYGVDLMYRNAIITINPEEENYNE